MSLRNKLRFVGLTDTGKVREHNEDTIAVDPDIGLLVLADGMGGYNAGEVASGIAVKTIVNLVREQIEREDLNVQDREAGLSRPTIILRDSIQRANKIIYQTARTQPQCEGMGTTVVAALFFDNKVTIAHVGDSRMYRQRGDKLEQVTMDHSLLQELVDRGFYSAEEAQRAANKNYVTRALGVEPNVEVEIQEVPVGKGEVFILCSDGLSDMVEDEDIHLTINTFSANLDTVAKQLIQLSNDNGGRDNVSVVMAYVNGKLIKKHALQHGDVITVGHHQLRFVEDDEQQDEFEKTMVIQPSARPVEKVRTAAEAVDQASPSVSATGKSRVLSDAAALKKAKLQVLSGAFAGRELELSKALTTLGRPGVQVAAITRRAEGYFIVHVDSGKTGDYPLLNGSPIGAQATRLSDNDVIQLAGVKMGFFVN